MNWSWKTTGTCQQCSRTCQVKVIEVGLAWVSTEVCVLYARWPDCRHWLPLRLSCIHGSCLSFLGPSMHVHAVSPAIFTILLVQHTSYLPSGEPTKSNGKSPFLMGKSTISMAIFNCYVKLPEGNTSQSNLFARSFWTSYNVGDLFACSFQIFSEVFNDTFHVAHESPDGSFSRLEAPGSAGMANGMPSWHLVKTWRHV